MDVHEIIEKTVAGLGYQVVDVERSQHGRVLRVFIDKPEKPRGVDIEDCALVSNQLSRVLIVEDVDYDRLEVSSPGLDRPLFGAAQFARFAGQTAKVTLKLPQDGRRRFQGAILRVDGPAIVFAIDNAEFEVDAANIDKARLVPDWVALGLAPAMDKSGRDARPGKQRKTAGQKPPAKNTTNKNLTNKPSADEPSSAE